ncbi:hypothetical protein GETHOR_07510 [Geothrix oryzae]|uniref:Nuclear transport factor 2 family protein n=1 Tax=Geothrix oryzae TaxID=2927975 RepID=A0ABN6UVL6_9BACT|nr:hypothetical protein [Geothrix oryzae]BDU68650.1 hypothetical protein GETHOR_07510 [Geothrix oryzae]
MIIKNIILSIIITSMCIAKEPQKKVNAMLSNNMIKIENNKYVYVKRWFENHFGAEIDLIIAGKDLNPDSLKREITTIVKEYCDSPLKDAFLARIASLNEVELGQHYLVKCEPYSEAFFMWTKVGLIDVVTVKFYGSL